MGKKPKMPAPPKLEKATPELSLMPDQNVMNYQQGLGEQLTNMPNFDTYNNQSNDAFISNLTKSIQKTYEPLQQNLINNVGQRFGGLNNSVFTDMNDRMSERMADSIGQATNSYLQNAHNQNLSNQMNYETSILNRLNALQGMQQVPYNVGAMMAVPQNAAAQQNYNNQLQYYNNARNQGGGLGGAIGGGLSGAATGASIGSIVPGIGTGIGALVGGGLGLLGGMS